MWKRAKTWLVVGMATAVVLLAASWLLLIKPQQSHTSQLKDQAANSAIEVTHRQHILADLRRQNDSLASYKADLAKAEAALPSSDGIPDFLRATQAIGARTGVTVSTIAVQDPAPAAADGTDADSTSTDNPSTYQVVITMVASGSFNEMTAFLKQLQTGQPRAVLITVAATSPATQGAASGISLNLTVKVFVSPPAAASTTTPTK
jgi:Tfp pilus assembly protein PilO